MVITGPHKQEAPLGLAGGQATKLYSRNLTFSLKLPSSTWVGAPVLLKNSKDIVMHISLSRNQDLSQGCTTI